MQLCEMVCRGKEINVQWKENAIFFIWLILLVFVQMPTMLQSGTGASQAESSQLCDIIEVKDKLFVFHLFLQFPLIYFFISSLRIAADNWRKLPVVVVNCYSILFNPINWMIECNVKVIWRNGLVSYLQIKRLL